MVSSDDKIGKWLPNLVIAEEDDNGEICVLKKPYEDGYVCSICDHISPILVNRCPHCKANMKVEV